MARIKDHPDHVSEGSYINPAGTDGQFLDYNEFIEETGEPLLRPPVPIAEKYGLIQIIAVYNRYKGTGVGGTSILTDSSASWVPDRWIDWFVQASDTRRYRIIGNDATTLTIGGPYEIPDGEYYIIKDRDFAGFEFIETNENWEPIPSGEIISLLKRNVSLLDGGTKVSYLLYRKANGFYYFIVNSVDTQGLVSLFGRKSKTRIWVGEEPYVPEGEKDSSLTGTTTSIGFGFPLGAYIVDTTKNWEPGSFKEGRDSITIDVHGVKINYTINFVGEIYPGGDTIYIKKREPISEIPPYTFDYEIIIASGGSGTDGRGGGGRIGGSDETDDDYIKPGGWYRGGDID